MYKWLSCFATGPSGHRLQESLPDIVSFLFHNPMKLLQYLFLLCALLPQTRSKEIWSSEPASWDDIIRQVYPIGNGRLGGQYSQCFAYKSSAKLM